jgi:hypothetical protein
MRRALRMKRSGNCRFHLPARAREGKVSMLPSSEFEAGTTCFEPEGHRISGDSLSIHKSHLIFGHVLPPRWNLTWFSFAALRSSYVNHNHRNFIPTFFPDNGEPSTSPHFGSQIRQLRSIQRNYSSTISWPFIPPWPIPQRLQQWNE